MHWEPGYHHGACQNSCSTVAVRAQQLSQCVAFSWYAGGRCCCPPFPPEPDFDFRVPLRLLPPLLYCRRTKGRCLLLYPGGAKETFKTGKSDKYQLMWHEKIVSDRPVRL